MVRPIICPEPQYVAHVPTAEYVSPKKSVHHVVSDRSGTFTGEHDTPGIDGGGGPGGSGGVPNSHI